MAKTPPKPVKQADARVGEPKEDIKKDNFEFFTKECPRDYMSKLDFNVYFLSRKSAPML